MKRPLLIVALAYASGIFLGDTIAIPLQIVLSLAVLLAGSVVIWSESRTALLLPLVVLTGWASQTLNTRVLSPHDLRSKVGDEPAYARLRGTIVKTPTLRVYQNDETETWSTMARLRVESIALEASRRPAHGTVAVSTSGLLPVHFFAGQRVEIRGVIQPPRGPVAPGLFDYRKYLQRQGIYYTVRTRDPSHWRLVDTADRFRDPPLPELFRQWAQTTLSLGIHEEDESLRLMWAMSLGWRTALTDEVSEPFMHSGTMHIFAISGLHIAVIAGMLVVLTRILQLLRSIGGLIVIPMLWFYTAATGWQASAVRSTLMMTIIVGGWALKRPGDLLNSVGAAAFIILLWEPQQLFQASFQLSFCVVISLALLLPPFENLRRRLVRTDPLLPPELRPGWRRWLDKPIRFVTTSMAVSLAAWLGSLPLVATYFNLVTPVSLLANLIVVHLAGATLASIMGSLLCGLWLPGLSILFNHSAWFWMSLMLKLSAWFGTLPGAYYHVAAPSIVFIVCYYGLLFLLLNGSYIGWRRYAVAGVLVCLFGHGLAGAVRNRSTVRITALPLDGGDSVYVNDVGVGGDLLIDCGGEDEAIGLVKQYLRANGVNRLDGMLLTHGDKSHVGGFRFLNARFSCQETITSFVRFRSTFYRGIEEELDASERTWRRVDRGDGVGLWRVLYPLAETKAARADDAPLVLSGVIHGARILLLSDLSRLGLRNLLSLESDLRADIVFINEPLEGTSPNLFFLEMLNPKVVIVTGRQFRSGNRWARKLRVELPPGTVLYHSGESGAIQLEVTPGRCVIAPMEGERLILTKPYERDR